MIFDNPFLVSQFVKELLLLLLLFFSYEKVSFFGLLLHEGVLLSTKYMGFSV